MTTSLVLVLHGHLPFVRDLRHERHIEESWLYEALAECYLPLLEVLEGLDADGVDWNLHLGLTPTLCDMLSHPSLELRFSRYLDETLALTDRVLQWNGFPELAESIGSFRKKIDSLRCFWWEHRDVLAAFRRLAETGRLQLLASSATHAFLPGYKNSPKQVCVQIKTGLNDFRRRFGRVDGFWLPECGYDKGLSEILGKEKVRYFFLETHGVLLAEPPPETGVYCPLQTPGGPWCFGRDQESSQQVWSREKGFPGHPFYREFHRDLGAVLPSEVLGNFFSHEGKALPTGLRPWKIGEQGDDSPYDPDAAEAMARFHARRFVKDRVFQGNELSRWMDGDPVITAPYDAELFGHWWFEGPCFLDELFRESFRSKDLRLVSALSILEKENRKVGKVRSEPAWSSWGEGGYAKVWMNEKTAWMWPELLRIGSRMEAVTEEFAGAIGLEKRILLQLSRELMLAQSSDWPFQIYHSTYATYATRRFREHVENFDALESLLWNNRELSLLEELEKHNDIFS